MVPTALPAWKNKPRLCSQIQMQWITEQAQMADCCQDAAQLQAVEEALGAIGQCGHSSLLVSDRYLWAEEPSGQAKCTLWLYCFRLFLLWVKHGQPRKVSHRWYCREGEQLFSRYTEDMSVQASRECDWTRATATKWKEKKLHMLQWLNAQLYCTYCTQWVKSTWDHSHRCSGPLNGFLAAVAAALRSLLWSWVRFPLILQMPVWICRAMDCCVQFWRIRCTWRDIVVR